MMFGRSGILNAFWLKILSVCSGFMGCNPIISQGRAVLSYFPSFLSSTFSFSLLTCQPLRYVLVVTAVVLMVNQVGDQVFNKHLLGVKMLLGRNSSQNLSDIRGTWVAQLVKRPTLARVMITRFVTLSPLSDSVLTAQSLEPASNSLSAPPATPHSQK